MSTRRRSPLLDRLGTAVADHCALDAVESPSTSKSRSRGGTGMVRAMGSAGQDAGRWRLRTGPGELAARYVEAGWWPDQSLGDMVADGLGAMGDAAFAVHSAVRPW